MKGLIYVVAFTIGSAMGPIALAPASPQSSSISDTVSRSAADETVGTPDEAAQPLVGQVEEAVDAKVVIEAPSRGRVGELIRFDVSQSVADSVKWLLVPGSADFESYDDGRRAVFSARAPGDYMFIIAVAKGGSVDVITHTVKVEGPPQKPESQSLADWVPYWLYPVQLPREEALRLAESFEDVAARITALSTPKGVIEATAEANRAALGDSLDSWKPILVKIQSALANRARAGTLTTPEQHRETWREIAAGLRRYAQ